MSQAEPADDGVPTDPQARKERIVAFVEDQGAHDVGIADVDEIERHVPEGYSPRDILPSAQSAIVAAVSPLSTIYDTPQPVMDTLGTPFPELSKIAAPTQRFIEDEFGYKAIRVGGQKDALVPANSHKVHAEHAGLGLRGLNGDIILSPDHGMIYLVSILTSMELPPDGKLDTDDLDDEDYCPHPRCVDMWEAHGTTICIERCPVDALEGELDDAGEQAVMKFDKAACESVANSRRKLPRLLQLAIEEDGPDAQMVLNGSYINRIMEKLRFNWVSAQCFQCVEPCPIVKDKAKDLE